MGVRDEVADPSDPCGAEIGSAHPRPVAENGVLLVLHLRLQSSSADTVLEVDSPGSQMAVLDAIGRRAVAARTARRARDERGLRPANWPRAAGVNVQTLRYYERRGLLAEPDRTLGGHRLYPPETVTCYG